MWKTLAIVLTHYREFAILKWTAVSPVSFAKKGIPRYAYA